MPLVVIVLVLMVLVLLTLKVLRSVKVSPAASPNTAAPVMLRLWVLPTTVPLVVMMLPVKLVSAPKVTASL